MLKFTPRTISEMEYEKKCSYTEVLKEFSVSNVILIVKKGLGIGATDRDAEGYLESLMKEKSLDKIFIDLVTQLQEENFLPKAVDPKETAPEGTPEGTPEGKTGLSPQSGKKEKAQQSE